LCPEDGLCFYIQAVNKVNNPTEVWTKFKRKI